MRDKNAPQNMFACFAAVEEKWFHMYAARSSF